MAGGVGGPGLAGLSALLHQGPASPGPQQTELGFGDDEPVSTHGEMEGVGRTRLTEGQAERKARVTPWQVDRGKVQTLKDRWAAGLTNKTVKEQTD